MEPTIETKAAEPEPAFAPNYLRAFCKQEVKASNPDALELLHLITTAATDRAGDQVEPSGAAVDNFMKNPVVMANHAYSIENVIGRATKVYSDESGMWARTKFRDTPLAMAAYRLAGEGLGGWSIGFRPMDYHSVREGATTKLGCKSCQARWKDLTRGKEPGEYVSGEWSMHFMKWELLEYSSVAIPMNQEIVNNAVKRGLVSPEHVRAFFLASSPAPSSEVSHRSSAREIEAVRAGLQPVERAIRDADDKSVARNAVEAIVSVAREMTHGT